MFAHVQAWQQSGLTQKAYCRQHHIAPHLFSYWLKRYRLLEGQQKGFVPVTISSPPSTGAPVMEPVLASGSRLLFYTRPEPAYLHSLLA